MTPKNLDSLRAAIIPYYQWAIDKLDAPGKKLTRVKVTIEAREVFLPEETFGKEWKETVTLWSWSPKNDRIHSDVVESLAKHAFFSLGFVRANFPGQPQALEIKMKYRFKVSGTQHEIELIDDQLFYLKFLQENGSV